LVKIKNLIPPNALANTSANTSADTPPSHYRFAVLLQGKLFSDVFQQLLE